jgi:hypothetical protein
VSSLHLTLGDGTIPAPEPTAELAEAAAKLLDVLFVGDVDAQADGIEECEEHRHQNDPFHSTGGKRDDETDDPNHHVCPHRALESGVPNLLPH